jgi:hypothetical protein
VKKENYLFKQLTERKHVLFLLNLKSKFGYFISAQKPNVLNSSKIKTNFVKNKPDSSFFTIFFWLKGEHAKLLLNLS